MKLIPKEKLKSPKKSTKDPLYEIEIVNIDTQPDWFQDREYSFLSPSLKVLIPYLPDVEAEK